MNIPEQLKDLSYEQVGRLEIVNLLYQEAIHDGYGFVLRIDGKTMLELHPDNLEMREKRIVLLLEAGYDVCVVTIWRDGSETVLVPSEFDLRIGDLHVCIDKEHFPCRIEIAGIEPKIKILRIEFAVGQAVWVDMRFLPVVVTEPAVIVEKERGKPE